MKTCNCPLLLKHHQEDKRATKLPLPHPGYARIAPKAMNRFKGMPKGKTLVGSPLQPRAHRDTKRKRKNSANMPNFVIKPNEND